MTKSSAETMLARAKVILADRKGDKSQAHKLLLAANKLKSAEAAYALGSWYLHGFQVKRDYEKAAALLTRAMKLGSGDAAYDLGICFEVGRGVRKSLRGAFRCYTHAALLLLLPQRQETMYSFQEAAEQLARCYYHGIGTPVDRALSRRWRDAAAGLER